MIIKGRGNVLPLHSDITTSWLKIEVLPVDSLHPQNLIRYSLTLYRTDKSQIKITLTNV